MESIKQVLMRRDDMSEQDADDLIAEARSEVMEIAGGGGSLSEVEDVVKDYFGLEPDYVMELIP